MIPVLRKDGESSRVICSTQWTWSQRERGEDRRKERGKYCSPYDVKTNVKGHGGDRFCRGHMGNGVDVGSLRANGVQRRLSHE